MVFSFLSIKNNLDNIAFFLLLIGLLNYWTYTAFPSFKITRNIGFITIALANLTLAILLSWRWIENGYFPLSNLYESLLFFTWGLTSISLTVEIKTSIALVGATTSPLALFVIGFASLSLPEGMQKAAPLVPALKSNWLMMHVSIMMISYSTLIIGSLLSILFLILTKGKNVEIQGSSTGRALSLLVERVETEVISTPLSLLESIDNLSYRIIGLGFPLLTIGIISGAVWANEAWGSYWSWDPKETWALITWLVFASYLHTRINRSWQGKGPAVLASVGFIVVWVCYLGVNFLGKGLHSYGWLL